MEKKDKQFLIKIGLVGVIIALVWIFKRWYFVYKCNILIDSNTRYGYDSCYFVYHGEMPTHTPIISIMFGGLLLLAVFGFLVFCWMYIPQKAVSNFNDWLKRKR